MERLRLSPHRLSALAGVHRTTIAAIADGSNPNAGLRTVASIDAALKAEELALRDYLLALYPLDAAPLRHAEAAE